MEDFDKYIFGKKTDKHDQINSSYCASQFCKILGINTTVFIRRVGCVMGNLT